VLDALDVIRQAHADGIRPDALLTVSEWADAHRRLPKKSSAEPGQWRTSRTPYLREIMDCFSSTSEVEEVVLMKAAQVGGSEAILNALGYAIDHCPGPVILVQPTVDLAKRFSRQRLEPLVTDTPRLAEKVPPARSRDSGNTVLGKEFPGGQLIITGANSAVGLRSMPAQYALMDEIDGYELDIDEEGSPIALVEARQRTFARKKRMKVSTPTIAGVSAIESAYEASDQRRFYVPCPHCGEMQPLEFKRLKWQDFGLPPERAVYECRACLFRIQNHQKTQMLAAGEWRPELPERVGKVRGYHLSALYAPVGWISWGDIAKGFVETHQKPEKFRVFVNTVLGDAWKERGEAPEWERLYQRRELYAAKSCPPGVLFLTAGVDVQHNRFVYEVVGWGREMESWSIDYGVIAGDTSDTSAKGPWPELNGLLGRSYQSAAGVPMPILRLAIDSGDQTQTVYNWARKHPLTRVIAVKGVDTAGALVGMPSKVDVASNGKKLTRSYLVWPVAGHIAKSELYGWLNLSAPTDEARADGARTPPGYCHFPQYGEDYFKQLTAEHLVRVRKRGRLRLAWDVIIGRENHVLDCRVYARAAAAVVGLDRFQESDWRQLEQRLGVVRKEPAAAVAESDAGPAAAQQPASTAPASAQPQKKQGWIPRRPSGWLRGGR
jgi:phage terminase large subunit GpA-like protein